MKQWTRWCSSCTGAASRGLSAGALFLIALYRTTFSGWWGGICRFQPTCSHYAQTAFQTYPPLLAGKFTLIRLLKCHPLGPFGFDPVPEVLANRDLPR